MSIVGSASPSQLGARSFQACRLGDLVKPGNPDRLDRAILRRGFGPVNRKFDSRFKAALNVAPGSVVR